MIDQLTNQEKSALLAKAVGWKIVNSDRTMRLQFVYDNNGTQLHVSRDEPFLPHNAFDLYNPTHMVLAKKAFMWGYANVEGFRAWLDMPHHAKHVLIGSRGVPWALDTLIIEANKVNLPAIEASLIELEEERG